METKTKADRAAKVQTIDPAAIARLLGVVQGGTPGDAGPVIPQGPLAAFYHS